MDNAMTSSLVHVSRGRLDEIGMGDPSFTVELIEIMISDGGERVQKLRAAFEARRFEEVGKVAHSLKGAALNVGALSLATLCANIDEIVRKLNSEITADHVNSLETEFEFVANELEQIRSELIA